MPHTQVGRSEDLLAELAAWVAMETPTTDPASVNRLMDVAEGELARAGAALTRIPGLQQRVKTNRPIVSMLTPDEEVGSPTSREWIEREASEAAYVLIPEPAGHGGACVTARKGVGRFVMRVEGRGAHSGGAFEEGASAVVELARQIVRIHGMVDLDRGITLNAAPVWGGSRPNVISPDAGCEIDLRVNSVGDGVHMERMLLESTALTPGCRVVVAGGSGHPRAVPQGARHRRDGGNRVAAPASRRRIGWQFHRGDGRADAGRTGLPRLRRACQPRAHIVAATCAARGTDGGTVGDARLEHFRGDWTPIEIDGWSAAIPITNLRCRSGRNHYNTRRRNH